MSYILPARVFRQGIFLVGTCSVHGKEHIVACDHSIDPDRNYLPSTTIMPRRTGTKRRRVEEVDDAVEEPDEPQQLRWFGPPVPIPQTPQPASTTAPIQIQPALYGVQAFLNAQHYEGDLTEDQVIENVQNLPNPVYGKVNNALISYNYSINGEQTQNQYMREWLPRRAQQLETILTNAAPKEAEMHCTSCHTDNAKWRCRECFGRHLLCAKCCMTQHRYLPFHRVDKWNGRFFQRAALWQVGVKLFLGHQGLPCNMMAEDVERGNVSISVVQQGII